MNSSQQPTLRLSSSRKSSGNFSMSGEVPSARVVEPNLTGSLHARSRSGSAMTTIKQVFLHRWKDWLFLACAIVVLGCAELAPGKRMYLTPEMWEEVKFPFKDNTVPSWTLPILSLAIPLGGITITGRAVGLSLHDQHGACLGLLSAVAYTTVTTDIIKITVGRARPSFYYRCFPDGKEAFEVNDNGQRVPTCHPVKESHVIDGYKSFPSGHTSLSFAGLFYLSLFLYHHADAWNAKQGGIISFLEASIATIPTLIAVWVGCTRISDYAHNYTDVAAGAVLGSAIAYYFFKSHLRFCAHKQLVQTPDVSPDVQMAHASRHAGIADIV